MRIRHVGMLAAAWAAVGLGTVRGGDPPSEKPGPPITIIASPATLKVGARCRVELNPVTSGPRETVTTYEGTITKANDQGVGLTVVEEKTTISVKPLARKPFLDRFFRNVGIALPDPAKKGKEVWLPGATIRSVKLIEQFAAAQVPFPSFPLN